MDGSRYPVEIRIRTVSLEGHRFRVIGLEDITVRKSVERSLQRQSLFVQILQRVAAASNEASSSREAMQMCLELICTYGQWPVGHVYLRDPVEHDYVSSDLWYIDQPKWFEPFRQATSRARFMPGVGLVGRVALSGKPEWMFSVSAQSDFMREQAARDLGVTSGCALPILVGSEVVAVAEFFSDRVQQPDDDLMDLMGNVGVQLGRVVERERAQEQLRRHAQEVREMSLVDDLTQLHNRRGFLSLGKHQLKASDRHKRKLHLFFADMDGLKEINDRFGHATGDKALLSLAEVLKTTFRDSDILARLGGDEFVALATGLEDDGVKAIIDRFQENMRAYNARSGAKFKLAASVGVTTYDPKQPETIEELLLRADATMYEQKRQRKGLGPTLSPARAGEG
jgi:diguanylate cyclase (GGDEF)-like protein